jgi:hypothetical protein
VKFSSRLWLKGRVQVVDVTLLGFRDYVKAHVPRAQRVLSFPTRRNSHLLFTFYTENEITRSGPGIIQCCQLFRTYTGVFVEYLRTDAFLNFQASYIIELKR